MRYAQLLIILLCWYHNASAQDIELFQQFNGRYDYTAIGNTLNTEENGVFSNCTITTSSSAALNLNNDQTIIAAYLYWAGSGNGDFEISLNANAIFADRIFFDSLDNNRVFFAAFADVTDILLEEGNAIYSISDFDISETIPTYCPTGTNFAGWAITVIYEDDSLPLNQLNVYDGLQSVPTQLNITLENLNVLDNENAKIGFVAWEGDRNLAVNEQLRINGNLISNLPLNPPDNAFNGTNSFTGANDLHNMDIDVYNIQNNIAVGDTQANISLTSGQDFVMINNIITVLNSQTPDATITIANNLINCGDNYLEVDYSIYNTNGTAVLPSGTPIAFYANDILVEQTQTQTDIPINGSENGFLLIEIPDNLGDEVVLRAAVDDDGTSNGIVTELNEDNNSDLTQVTLLPIPEPMALPNLTACNEGLETAGFNLWTALENTNFNENNVSFYRNLEDLETQTNSITSPEMYTNFTNPEIIYIRKNLNPCYEVYQFNLIVDNCPPIIPQGFSPNDDRINDWFNIQGLYDIFLNHKLMIYNRFGDLIFEGDNNTPWLGKINRGLNNHGQLVPVGTYFYVLHLNDPDYQSVIGYVYVNY